MKFADMQKIARQVERSEGVQRGLRAYAKGFAELEAAAAATGIEIKQGAPVIMRYPRPSKTKAG